MKLRFKLFIDGSIADIACDMQGYKNDIAVKDNKQLHNIAKYYNMAE